MNSLSKPHASRSLPNAFRVSRGSSSLAKDSSRACAAKVLIKSRHRYINLLVAVQPAEFGLGEHRWWERDSNAVKRCLLPVIAGRRRCSAWFALGSASEEELKLIRQAGRATQLPSL